MKHTFCYTVEQWKVVEEFRILANTKNKNSDLTALIRNKAYELMSSHACVPDNAIKTKKMIRRYVKLPKDLSEKISCIALNKNMSPTEYLRRFILDPLINRDKPTSSTLD